MESITLEVFTDENNHVTKNIHDVKAGDKVMTIGTAELGTVTGPVFDDGFDWMVPVEINGIEEYYSVLLLY